MACACSHPHSTGRSVCTHTQLSRACSPPLSRRTPPPLSLSLGGRTASSRLRSGCKRRASLWYAFLICSALASRSTPNTCLCMAAPQPVSTRTPQARWPTCRLRYSRARLSVYMRALPSPAPRGAWCARAWGAGALRRAASRTQCGRWWCPHRRALAPCVLPSSCRGAGGRSTDPPRAHANTVHAAGACVGWWCVRGRAEGCRTSYSERLASVSDEPMFKLPSGWSDEDRGAEGACLGQRESLLRQRRKAVPCEQLSSPA